MELTIDYLGLMRCGKLSYPVENSPVFQGLTLKKLQKRSIINFNYFSIELESCRLLGIGDLNGISFIGHSQL